VVLINSTIEIICIAIAINLFNQIVRRKFYHPKEQKEDQKKMKEIQKKQKELMNKTDEKSKKEAEKLTEEMMKHFGETMSKTNKIMIASFVIIIPLYMFVLPNIYGEIVFGLPFPIPWFGENWSILLYNETNWLGMFVLTSLIIGIIMNIALKVYEKTKEIK
jgi:uncharacterized membrane protein (DUF106 family)